MAYIIADIGSNYIDLDNALFRIEEAAKAGVDAVKFQAFRQNKLFAKNSGVDITPYELPYEWLVELQDLAHRNGLDFMCSAFDPESAKIINEYVDKHKIASSEITNKTLVAQILEYHKPTYMSIGRITPSTDIMMKYPYFLEVTDWLRSLQEKYNITFLHCLQDYPTELNRVNLAILKWFHATFRRFGISDHTTDYQRIPFMGIALGCTTFEKHFKGELKATTPDSPHSLNVRQMLQYVKNIELAEAMMYKTRTDQIIQRTIQAAKDMDKGTLLTAKDLNALRAGNNISGDSCWYIDQFIGKILTKSVREGEGISEDMVKTPEYRRKKK